MQVASVISCLVRVYVLPVAVVGFTWETISDMSTSSMSGGSGNVNDGAGKCGGRKVTMTEPASASIDIMQPSQPNPSYSTSDVTIYGSWLQIPYCSSPINTFLP